MANQPDKLYYCHRCGVIIDPEGKKTCIPSAFGSFLFEK